MKYCLTLAFALSLSACSEPPDAATGEPVALVALATAKMGAVVESIPIYGAAEAGSAARITLASPLEALVVAIRAPAGARVTRGSVIVSLAPSPASSVERDRAVSESQAADRTLARMLRLRTDGLVSDAEVEAARTASAVATATRDSLAQRTAALQLRATADGVVETVLQSPGDLVPAGSPIATLAPAGPLRARFGVDPALARRLHPGMEIRIGPASGEAEVTAPIRAVSPVIDPQTRLAGVFADLPVGAGVGQGEPLSGHVALGSAAQLLTIPYSALLDEAGQPFVFSVAKGVASRRDVVIGPTDGRDVAILKGLAPGDQVVTQGGTALTDGIKVRTQ
ncbi:MAG: efflux RND transporter periplasmic adaptor subunit [Pseudomonadota bacterium]